LVHGANDLDLGVVSGSKLRQLREQAVYPVAVVAHGHPGCHRERAGAHRAVDRARYRRQSTGSSSASNVAMWRRVSCSSSRRLESGDS